VTTTVAPSSARDHEKAGEGLERAQTVAKSEKLADFIRLGTMFSRRKPSARVRAVWRLKKFRLRVDVGLGNQTASLWPKAINLGGLGASAPSIYVDDTFRFRSKWRNGSLVFAGIL
jgi:hypothetical protein